MSSTEAIPSSSAAPAPQGAHGSAAGGMAVGEVAYFQGEFVPIADANVNIMTHALNYGTGVFEGIRGYYSRAEERILIFRLREHIDRLARNLRMMFMEIPEDDAAMSRVCIDLVRQCGFQEDVYIRPLVYKSSYILTPMLHGVESQFCCYCIKLGDYVDTASGLDVAVSSWRRLGDNSIPSRAKATGAYLNSALAATDAKMSGFDEAIFLREDGTVSEGSAMNIFVVQGRTLVTTQPDADILLGVTRNTVIELARDVMGLEVVERPIGRTELYVSDEVFFCGTGAQVAPVRSVDRRTIGNGQPGPLTRELQKLYFDVVQGRVERYRHWCTPVE